MKYDGYEFMIESGAKFYQSAYVSGWFHHPIDTLSSLRVVGDAIVAAEVSVLFDHPGVSAAIGGYKGFRAQVLLSHQEAFQSLVLQFVTAQGKTIEARLLDLCHDRVSRFETPRLLEKFKDLLGPDIPRILDVGGRARSRLDRSTHFPGTDYTVFDILPGDNVDVVGDAHELSEHFNHNSFDGVYSVSVFEHLLMPWKVALEINKVLKIGGVALIHTHQTLGMHDLPWDFYRFSADAWAGLFNEYTGFEVLDRAMDAEQYVVPFVFRPGKEKAEASVGFEGSGVLVRKVANSKLHWDVKLRDVVSTIYPDTDDGQHTRDYV